MMLIREINKTLEILQKGGIILYPSDTIWGLGCDATNKEAVKKIYTLKKRNETKSLIILLDDVSKLKLYVKELPSVSYNLIKAADKPLTIIYLNGYNLAENIVNADGSVAIRVAKDNFCNALIKRFNKPIVSTSANISGNPPPKSFQDISTDILNGVDYVVNLRQNEQILNNPSKIIKLEKDGSIKLIRT